MGSVVKGDIERSEAWKAILTVLHFSKSPEKEARKIGSYYIMGKCGFKVEFSCGHLWEIDAPVRGCIDSISDLKRRYRMNTKMILRTPKWLS